MMLLSDVLSIPALEKELEAGYVKRVVHPAFPYAILNYTDKCQYEGRWNDVTRVCRGLIYDYNTNEVIARGPEKFFNHGQPGAAAIALDDWVHVADKADGSLGIAYQTPEGDWAIATRGSFTSDQALHATANLTPKDIGPVEGYTEVFEIVYPENRVVVDYGDRDELVYLGLVHKETGRFFPTPVQGYFGVKSYADALAMPPRKNAEGLVLTRISDGAMVKVKQEDYLRLHKAIFGLSARKLWEILVRGEDLNAYIASLPDELQPWAKETALNIETLTTNSTVQLLEDFAELVDSVERIYGAESWDRADFAREVAMQNPGEAWAMFALLDGKDIYPMVLKRNRPEAFVTPVVQHGEDVA